MNPPLDWEKILNETLGRCLLLRVQSDYFVSQDRGERPWLDERPFDEVSVLKDAHQWNAVRSARAIHNQVSRLVGGTLDPAELSLLNDDAVDLAALIVTTPCDSIVADKYLDRLPTRLTDWGMLQELLDTYFSLSTLCLGETDIPFRDVALLADIQVVTVRGLVWSKTLEQSAHRVGDEPMVTRESFMKWVRVSRPHIYRMLSGDHGAEKVVTNSEEVIEYLINRHGYRYHDRSGPGKATAAALVSPKGSVLMVEKIRRGVATTKVWFPCRESDALKVALPQAGYSHARDKDSQPYGRHSALRQFEELSEEALGHMPVRVLSWVDEVVAFQEGQAARD